MAVETVLIDKYVCDSCGKAKATERGKLPPIGYHAVIYRVRRSGEKKNPIVRTRAVVFFCDKDCLVAGVTFNSYPSKEIPNEVPVQATTLRSPEGRHKEADIDRVRWGFTNGTEDWENEGTD